MSKDEVTIKDIGKMIQKRVRTDDDITICITGREGSGKSTFGMHLGMACDNKFDFENNVLYSPKQDELFKKMVNGKKYQAIVSDEAIKILYKLQWHKQVFINQLFNLCRQENKINILILPRFTDLGEYFREHRVYLWIHVIKRGLAVVLAYDDNPFTKDPWNIKANEKIIRKQLKGQLRFNVGDSEFVSALKKCSNYLTYLTCGALTQEQDDLYKELKAKYKYEEMNEGQEKKIGRREAKRIKCFTKAINLLTQNGYTQKDIGKQIGLDQSSISRLLEEGDYLAKL